MEYGFQYAIARAASLILLELIGDIGCALLESSIARHLAWHFERELSRFREHAPLQGLDVGFRSQARAGHVFAKTQRMPGLLESPVGLELRHAKSRTYELEPL
jgi:hypothetical protein